MPNSTAPLPTEFVQGACEALDGFLHLGQESEAGLGQRNLSCRPGQKLDAEILFQLANAVAESCLRQVQVRRGMLKAASLRNGDEGMKSQKIDAHSKLQQGLLPVGQGGRAARAR